MKKTGQRYGINVITGTLRGENTAKLRAYRINEYEEYGKYNEMSVRFLKDIVNTLTERRMLAITNDKYALLKLTTKGMELFEQLRSLRLQVAKERGIPPYLVAADRTLYEMCVRLPFTKQEMMAVYGMGERKYEQYGERFVEHIRMFTSGKKEEKWRKSFWRSITWSGDSLTDTEKNVSHKRGERPGFLGKRRSVRGETAMRYSGATKTGRN